MPELTKEVIAAVIAKWHPATFASLKKCLEDERVRVSDEELLPLIRQMQSERSIKLFVPAKAGSFEEYITSYSETWWAYLTMIIAVSESFLVFIGSETGPLRFFRTFFGLAMLGFIPGYLTVQIIFPGRVIHILEEVSLSVFLSVLVSISIGVGLGLGPYFLPSYNVLLLSLYVLVAAPVAAFRSYRSA